MKTPTTATTKPARDGKPARPTRTSPARIAVADQPPDESAAGRALTVVTLPPTASVATFDGWLHVWDGHREVRVGPLSAEQAQQLSDDLGTRL